MLLSQQHKILYIANPKTATTAVQRWLLSENDSFKKTLHEIKGKSIILEEHITALEAKTILGEKYYNELFVFVFVREPISKMISSYFFYKQAGKNKKLWDTNTKVISARIKSLFQFFLAKILPLNIWLIIYPYRDNFSYFTDFDENIIVRNIGRFEFLKQDLKRILKRTPLDVDFDKLEVVNKSKKSSSYRIAPFMVMLLTLRHSRLKKDMKFYRMIELGMTDENCD